MAKEQKTADDQTCLQPIPSFSFACSISTARALVGGKFTHDNIQILLQQVSAGLAIVGGMTIAMEAGKFDEINEATPGRLLALLEKASPAEGEVAVSATNPVFVMILVKILEHALDYFVKQNLN